MAKGSQKGVTPTHKVEFEGQIFNLAIPSKGRNLTKEQKIEIAKVVCSIYQTDRYTMKEVLKLCGIGSEATWWYWHNQIKEIEKLYVQALVTKTLIYRTRLKERALTAAEKLLTGYIIPIEEKRVEVVKNEATGQFEEILSSVIKKNIVIKPHAGVIRMVLVNMDKTNFQNNPSPILDNGEPIAKITVEIIGDTTPPITEEEEIKEV